MSSFGPVAPFYDQLMASVPYSMWVSYYQLLLAHQDIYPKRLLDVACGTGILAELLHAEAYEVTGFDLSASGEGPADPIRNRRCRHVRPRRDFRRSLQLLRQP